VTGIFFANADEHSFCILVNRFNPSMRQRIYRSPFILLLPFLFLYAAIIVFKNNDALFGDEARYLKFAGNLLNGFYSPPPPGVSLWNGPGFPLYLTPFLSLGLSHFVIKLFNAVLYYLALILFYKTLSKIFDAGKSMKFTVLAGLYYMPWKSLPHILSETFTIFLIAAITFLSVNYFLKKEKHTDIKTTILLAFLLSVLALTKVLFGHVYLFSALLFLTLFMVTKNIFYKRSFFLMCLALIFCLPYLLYTFHLTGRIFYWSNAGGMSLYWMSTPVNGEWGEWYNDSISSGSLDEKAIAQLKSNHLAEYDLIHSYEGVQRDDQFKKYAFKNIREHPLKYILNWIANWSRMFFNYPVSYSHLRSGTIANMVINIPLLLLLMYSAVLTWRNKNKLPFYLRFLLIISAVYLFGCSLISAYDRMLYILFPVLGLWICYSYSFFRRIKTA
jgi:hypothetical protein